MKKNQLKQIRTLSMSTLHKLVTDEGIFASSAQGLEGLYHGFFGRDTAITAHLISSAENFSSQQPILYKAVKGIVQMMRWQSTKDNPETGEEVGKFAHEVRTSYNDYRHLTDGFKAAGKRAWYVDPNDKVLKNWDSNDATQLWIIVIARMHEKGLISFDDEIRNALKNGLLWCIRNINEHGGFAGFTYNPNRTWGGLINQTWKDSEFSYLHDNAERPTYPLKDVFVNALTWSALMYGARIFETYDKEFSTTLKKEARELKRRFNDPTKGFLMKDWNGDVYFAEALDAQGKKLTGVSCDAALSLWAYCGEDSIIERKYIRSVIKRILMKDMFDKDAGIRTYSNALKVYDPVQYHRGPNTFWPFVSALIAEGISQYGYTFEARRILRAMIRGTHRFESCIEMFIKTPHGYEKFKEPATGQVSCTEQAWTAASLYFASQALS